MPPYKRKGSPVYHCKFQLPNGKWVQWSGMTDKRLTTRYCDQLQQICDHVRAGFDIPSDLLAWAANSLSEKRRVRLQEMLGVAIYPSIRLSDARRRVARWMTGNSAETAKTARLALASVMRVMGDVALADIDSRTVLAFKATRAEQVSAATVNKELRTLRAVMSHAVANGYIDRNPLLAVKNLLVREDQPISRIVTEAEFAAILEACGNPRVRCLFLIAYDCGLRRGELVALTGKDVTGDVVRVLSEAGRKTKTRQSRAVPMTARVREAVAPFAGSKERISPRRSPDQLSQLFKDAREKAGVEGVTLHKLRLAWSTRLQQAGVSLPVLRALGGWASSAVIERHYTGNLTKALHAAQNRLEAD